jgi:hypothetical protein
VDTSSINTIITATASLTGAIVGSLLTLLQSKSQRRSADLQRFHAERLELYREYLSLAADARAKQLVFQSWAKDFTFPLDPDTASSHADEVERYSEVVDKLKGCYGRMSLISNSMVSNAVGELHFAFGVDLNMFRSNIKYFRDFPKNEDEFRRLFSTAAREMRIELGVH